MRFLMDKIVLVFFVALFMSMLGCIKVSNFSDSYKNKTVVEELKKRYDFDQRHKNIKYRYTSKYVMVYGVMDKKDQNRICNIIQNIREINNLGSVLVQFWEEEKINMKVDKNSVQGSIVSENVNLLRELELD